jgi:5-methylcytosine-specific restriction protein A
MPYAPKRPCAHPMCREYALPGKPRCAVHQVQKQREYDARRLRFYLTGEWRKLSRAVRAANPVCPCGRPATIADHILPVRTHPALALDPSNLVARCGSCHSSRTSREQSWNRR